MKTAGIIGAVIPSIGVSVILSLLICCKSGTEKLFVASKLVMGTVVEITVAHRSEALARAAIEEALGEFQRIDDLMSSYRPDSAISSVNRDGSTTKVPVGEEVYRLLQDAVDISRASGGAFDVTIFPVSDLWGFDRTEGVPMPGLIAEKLKMVGYKNLLFDKNTASVGFSIPGMGVDLGAIAKGWAVDRAMERLAALGIRNAIIDAGGDLRTMGARPGRGFWRIGVRHPRAEGTLLFTFEVRDAAVVTSGDYERFFEVDGVRYHHIIDPATGYPARGCQSVTVLAPSTAEADACATAAFVLGPKEGMAFLRSRPGVQGVIVGADGRVYWSDESLSGEARR